MENVYNLRKLQHLEGICSWMQILGFVLIVLRLVTEPSEEHLRLLSFGILLSGFAGVVNFFVRNNKYREPLLTPLAGLAGLGIMVLVLVGAL